MKLRKVSYCEGRQGGSAKQRGGRSSRIALLVGGARNERRVASRSKIQKGSNAGQRLGQGSAGGTAAPFSPPLK